jgi:hypothetical protein
MLGTEHIVGGLGDVAHPSIDVAIVELRATSRQAQWHVWHVDAWHMDAHLPRICHQVAPPVFSPN